MIALALFASTFLAVFALGFQSQNVNQGHYGAAALTSLLISTGHIALYRFMPEADPAQLLAYYAGGVLGILASMWAHRRTLGRRRDTENPGGLPTPRHCPRPPQYKSIAGCPVKRNGTH